MKKIFYFIKYIAEKKFYIHLHPMRIALSKFIYLGFVLIFCSVRSWALAPSPPEPPQGTPPPGVPIDSSIVILIIAAIVYALYLTHKKIQTKAKI